jgi:hypothetical protein
MHNPWTQLKSRYLNVDIGIAFAVISFLLGIIYAILTSFFEFDKKALKSISEYPCYILIMLLICRLFILRLQRNGIDWRKMTGLLSFEKIPFMLILIIFQADFVGQSSGE